MTGLLQLLLLVSTTLASEPSYPACSKYDYDEKVLERMIRMEFAFEQDLTRLKNENKRLSAVVDTLMDQQEHAERRLVSRIEDVESKQTSTELVLANSNNTLEKISAAVDNMKDHVATPPVNFLARSPQTSSLSKGEVIVYTTVETNQGNGYSRTTGTFTAPAQGLYLFFMHTCTASTKLAFLHIVKEGSVLIGSVHYDQDQYTCSSSQVFVQLDVGENVWVQCSSGNSNIQLFDNIFYWTSFGGGLIHN
ncbi:complement C1q-like protein 4 [Mya arenaria]|uniref:complement C1q-like protein 4 n=1 Tax=Mya arenaria TaxID=6604 RepID=UPI0022E65B7B|nr:complement C1q-like protein 4 [Mya arenaria]